MKYRELIHKMQQKSGFSDAESAEALTIMVESLAERLGEGERKNFASQLPMELKDVALAAPMAERSERKKDLIEEFMEKEDIDAPRAKKQIMTAWETLKSFITEGQISHIKAQLPAAAAAMLY